MGLPLERWARQATLLDPPPDRVKHDLDDFAQYERMALPRLSDHLVESEIESNGALLEEAKREQRTHWHMVNGRLLEDGAPQALESLYGGLLAYPFASAGTAVTPAVATETAMWAAATYTPIPANSLSVPEVFRIAWTGQWTSTATASPTLVLTPRVGTTTGGGTLGASRAIPLVASITAANATIIGDLTCRTIGDGATGGSMIGFFHFTSTSAAGAGAAGIDELYGHTVATFDSKIAQGLFMGMTSNPAGATTSITTQQVHWMSWN